MTLGNLVYLRNWSYFDQPLRSLLVVTLFISLWFRRNQRAESLLRAYSWGASWLVIPRSLTALTALSGRIRPPRPCWSHLFIHSVRAFGFLTWCEDLHKSLKTQRILEQNSAKGVFSHYNIQRSKFSATGWQRGDQCSNPVTNIPASCSAFCCYIKYPRGSAYKEKRLIGAHCCRGFSP